MDAKFLSSPLEVRANILERRGSCEPAGQDVDEAGELKGKLVKDHGHQILE